VIIAPVPRSIDARTAALLSAAYGVFGGVTAILLMPEIAKHTAINLPFPLPIFAAILAVQLTAIYGLLGWCGLRLARRAGLEPAPALTRLWLRDPDRPSRVGPITAALAGLAAGACLVGAVKLITHLLPGSLPDMLHPPNLASALCASTAGALGEEILCRLLILSAILFVLRGSPSSRPIAIAVSALIFGALHTPAMVALYGSFASVPGLAWVWIIGLNAAVGCVFGAAYLRWGIGAAIAAHWCCDLVWHVGSVVLG
jgi:hypothetical protein